MLQPAEPLVAVARTRDGIVEAMELKPEAAQRMPFLLSVQFHPERLTERHAEHRAIFERFVRACAQTSEKMMNGKILIVDDQADVRELLPSVLEDDYEVAEAASGAALQKAFRRKRRTWCCWT